jgi:DNA repair protein RadA/Sms
MAKRKTKYICDNCGHESPRWQGQCASCSEWNTYQEVQTAGGNSSSGSSKGSGGSVITSQTVSQVSEKKYDRVSSGFSEFDRVLGEDIKTKNEGIVQGSVALISGDPGIGKSTLLMQVCANMTDDFKTVAYVSGEESMHQVAMRGKRIVGDDDKLESIHLVHSNNLEDILATFDDKNVDFAVIDSIQTIETSDSTGVAGGVAQVRSTTNKLVNYAKSRNVTLFIIGHINKEGNIAGPKILEHLVDTVIQIEGESDTDIRVVRSVKNRFGATNEVGIMMMDEDGMVDVPDPSKIFLTNDNVPGLCKSPILEGNRIIVVEVQSLISHTVYPYPKRVAEGVSVSRLQLICAILQKYVNVNLSDKDVYIKIGGGFRVDDRGIDLAIALSLLSSVRSNPLGKKSIATGEISLAGTINNVKGQSRRLSEVKRLGYKPIISSEKISNIRQINKFF